MDIQSVGDVLAGFFMAYIAGILTWEIFHAYTSK